MVGSGGIGDALLPLLGGPVQVHPQVLFGGIVRLLLHLLLLLRRRAAYSGSHHHVTRLASSPGCAA